MTFSHLAGYVFFSNLHHSRGLSNSLGYSLHYDTTSDAASHETCLSGSTADVSTCSSAGSYGTAPTSIQSQSISSGGSGGSSLQQPQSHESLWRWRPCVSTITSEDGIALRHFLTGAEDFYTYTYTTSARTSPDKS